MFYALKMGFLYSWGQWRGRTRLLFQGLAGCGGGVRAQISAGEIISGKQLFFIKICWSILKIRSVESFCVWRETGRKDWSHNEKEAVSTYNDVRKEMV